jgi:predicted DCC family thiol-disulfide oxidoreductase YuxK
MDNIIFFDGVCNLCNSSVNRLIKNDVKKVFKFASLQSEFAKSFVPDHLLNYKNLDTILFYKNGQFYDRSNAVLNICKALGGGFNLLLIGYLIPRFMRDSLYRLVANNRYKWFGKTKQCRVPTDDLKERFMD